MKKILALFLAMLFTVTAFGVSTLFGSVAVVRVKGDRVVCKALCKFYAVTLYSNFIIAFARVTDNRRRAYEITVGQTLDGLVLSPLSSWGDGETVDIVSFDFEA